jgi:hypothetical protein
VDDKNTKGFVHVLPDAMCSQEVAHEVYDEMLDKVVWDEEMSSELDMNNDLLRLLASGEECPVGEQVVDDSSRYMEFGLVVADHIFVEELNEDTKPVCKDVLSQQLESGSEYMNYEKKSILSCSMKG